MKRMVNETIELEAQASGDCRPTGNRMVGSSVAKAPLTHPSDSGFIEKRSYSRRAAIGHVICRMKSAGIESVVHARPVNLSRNGVLLDLPAELFAGVEVELEFLSASGRSVFVVSGRVRTVAPKELGRWQAGCAFHHPIPTEQADSFSR